MNTLQLAKNAAGQYLYRILRDDGSVHVPFQYGTFEERSTIAQANDRFGPCSQLDLMTCRVMPVTQAMVAAFGDLYNRHWDDEDASKFDKAAEEFAQRNGLSDECISQLKTAIEEQI